jgi:hypothetical protein
MAEHPPAPERPLLTARQKRQCAERLNEYAVRLEKLE